MELTFLHTPQIPLFEGGGATFTHFYTLLPYTHGYITRLHGGVWEATRRVYGGDGG